MRTQSSQKTRKMEGLEIRRFRSILEAQRDEVLRSLNRLGDETRGVDADYPKDSGDVCMTTLFREALFQQTSGRRLMVRRIEAALDRIQHGTFGVCVDCGDDINPKRLDAVPWTRHCLPCQEGFEQGEELEDRVAWWIGTSL